MCSSAQRGLGLAAGVVALGWLVGCHVDALLHPNAATNPPEIRLAFDPPPNGTVGQPLSPPVNVSAVDTAGRVDTTFRLDVTVTLDANPGRAALAGTRTVAAVKGVATFADLSLNQADTNYTFLATAPGLRGVTSPTFAIAAGPPTTGDLTVTTSTTGQNAPSGYTVTVDGGQNKGIGTTDSATYTSLTPASHTVALAAVPGNCSVSGGASQTVPVTAGDTARVSFAITCTATTGSLTVTTTTTGSSLPTADYSVSVDGGSGQSIHPTGSITVSVSVGSHTVSLTGVPSNCTVSGGTSQTVSVTASGGQATFTITCAAVPPPTGSVAVTTNTTGESLDPDGYTVAVSGAGSKAIAINQTVTFTGVLTGNQTVTLSGVAANCAVSGGTSETVTVSANQTVPAAFTITCTALPGSITVTTSTTGPNAPSSYSFSIDGGSAQTIGASTSVTVSSVSAGSHSVQLSTVPANCSVSEANPQSVTVPAGGSVTARFTITCTAITGSLTVTTTTTGSGIPTAAYSVSVDGGSGQQIPPNGTATFSGLSVGSHTVSLTGVPSNCTVSGGSSQPVTVTASGGQAAFTITCAAVPPPTGSVAVTTATTGASLPTADYTVTVEGGASQTIHPNGTATFTGLSVGSHAVTLSGFPSNCTVTGGATQTATVSASQTTPVSFAITCTALPGSLTVTTSTTGSSAPSNYTFSVDGGASQTIGASASVTVSGLSAGSHSVQLSTVPANCSVSETNPQSVTVPAGGSVTARFTVTCTAPNQPPTAAFTFSCNGLTCAFTDQSTDPDGSVASWSWTFGDGQTATQQNPSHTYSAGGSYTVTLTVKDNQNATSSPVSHTVTVTAPPPPNQPPVVTAGGDQTVLVGALFNLSGASFSDPDHNGPWTVTIDWGDGSSPATFTAAEGAISASHTYATVLPATYTLTVTVQDAGGLSGSASKKVSVTTL